MNNFSRSARNIYHVIRCLGLRKGLKVAYRIIFPPKISKGLLEFSKRFSKEDLDRIAKGARCDKQKRD